MSLSGSLATMQLGDLLQWCGSNLKTGTLRLTRGPIEKQLFFREGRLFSSTSTSPRETLGQFLIRSGQITEEELFTALMEQDRSDMPLGQILIAAGVIEERALEELLRVKTEESIYDAFLWKEGSFDFEEGRLPERIPVFVPLELTGVILEGARRSDEWERIHEVFPSRLTTFQVERTAREAAEDLSDEDRRLLQLVEQGKNLAEISLELHSVEFYAASCLLELYEKGLVTVRDAPEEIDFAQQLTELREKLKQGVECFHGGEYERSRECFLAALARDPQNKYARLFLQKIRRVEEDFAAFSGVPQEAVPRLRVPLAVIPDVDLDPHAGFVLSRVNGEWDIGSITKICPLHEREVLAIFKRLVDEGLIELEQPS
ncbi:MAG TPA: DUF4388 domain-containing protein [Vicinamibacteria bacterium]|nr:DUF4388 domain-containing protein [Vicinamibacteria bacterium]